MMLKTPDADRLSDIEANQATLRANITASQRLIDESCELLEKHRNGKTKAAVNRTVSSAS
jgi:hypothetical protein